MVDKFRDKIWVWGEGGCEQGIEGWVWVGVGDELMDEG